MLDMTSINKIQELYKQGTLKKDIAKIMNCSLTTVGKYTRNLQVEKDSMVGQKFGFLKVVSRAKKDPTLKSRSLRYVCLCDCGKEVEVNGNSLRTGHTTSCGCKRKDSISNKVENLIGQHFGNLVVIEKTNNREERHVLWKCKCSCGNIIEATGTQLKLGAIKSCGCIKSWKEQEIISFLQDKHIDYIKEYSFNDLKSDRNKKLRYDFAIFSKEKLLCLIEYQGEQHYNKNNKWHTKELEEHDLRKKEYCRNNNIPLIIFNKEDNLILKLEEMRQKYGL